MADEMSSIATHPGIRAGALSEALALLQSALKVLDAAGAPAIISGHVDLAVERLKEQLLCPWL